MTIFSLGIGIYIIIIDRHLLSSDKNECWAAKGDMWPHQIMVEGEIVTSYTGLNNPMNTYTKDDKDDFY